MTDTHLLTPAQTGDAAADGPDTRPPGAEPATPRDPTAERTANAASDVESPGGGSGGGNFEDSDDPYDQAVSVVLRDGKASTSYIQRRLGIGYNRAASIIEKMEREGIVGPANHVRLPSKKPTSSR